MPWDRTTDPKYRTKEHRDYRANLLRQLKRDGYLTCTADVCVFPSRTITQSNGNARDGLQAGHEPDGVRYRGPQHAACNLYDAIVRSNHPTTITPTRWNL
jgi:hypothetical protein